jgi:trimeric autotransporter adhesin
MEDMMEVKPILRPAAAQILDYSWFDTTKATIEEMETARRKSKATNKVPAVAISRITGVSKDVIGFAQRVGIRSSTSSPAVSGRSPYNSNASNKDDGNGNGNGNSNSNSNSNGRSQGHSEGSTSASANTSTSRSLTPKSDKKTGEPSNLMGNSRTNSSTASGIAASMVIPAFGSRSDHGYISSGSSNSNGNRNGNTESNSILNGPALRSSSSMPSSLTSSIEAIQHLENDMNLLRTAQKSKDHVADDDNVNVNINANINGGDGANAAVTSGAEKGARLGDNAGLVVDTGSHEVTTGPGSGEHDAVIVADVKNAVDSHRTSSEKSSTKSSNPDQDRDKVMISRNERRKMSLDRSRRRTWDAAESSQKDETNRDKDKDKDKRSGEKGKDSEKGVRASDKVVRAVDLGGNKDNDNMTTTGASSSASSSAPGSSVPVPDLALIATLQATEKELQKHLEAAASHTGDPTHNDHDRAHTHDHSATSSSGSDGRHQDGDGDGGVSTASTGRREFGARKDRKTSAIRWSIYKERGTNKSNHGNGTDSASARGMPDSTPSSIPNSADVTPRNMNSTPVTPREPG